MKGPLTALVVVIVGFAMPGAAQAGPNCSGSLPGAPSALPAPLVVTTTCGQYTALPGTAVVAAPAPIVAPVRGLWWPQDGVGWRNRHVYVVRNGEIVWRSRRAFPSPCAVAASADAVAFSISKRGLWIARFPRPEHRVGRGAEYPVAWTGAEMLLSMRWHRTEADLFARPLSGAARRRVASRVRAWVVDARFEELVFASADGRLQGTDGVKNQALADLGSFGLRGRVLLEAPGGGLIVVKGSDRIVVLRGDGSLFAKSTFPGLKRPSWGLNWFGSAAAGDDAVAFVIDQPDGDANDASDAVFVLREGDSAATPLLFASNEGDVCGHWVDLSWRGSWLLYSTTEARVVLFDLADLSQSLDLTRFVAQIPGAAADENGYVDNFGVEWAG
jgi:hypothetical protein